MEKTSNCLKTISLLALVLAVISLHTHIYAPTHTLIYIYIFIFLGDALPTLEIEVGVRKGIRPVVSTGSSVSVQLITDDTTNNEEMYIYVIAGTDSGKYLCMLKCVALTPDDNVILTVMLVITRLMSDKKILK